MISGSLLHDFGLINIPGFTDPCTSLEENKAVPDMLTIYFTDLQL